MSSVDAVIAEPRPYLNNIMEQDHRFIKKRITVGLGFRSADGHGGRLRVTRRCIAIRKRQIRWVAKGDPVAHRQFICHCRDKTPALLPALPASTWAKTRYVLYTRF